MRSMCVRGRIVVFVSKIMNRTGTKMEIYVPIAETCVTVLGVPGTI